MSVGLCILRDMSTELPPDVNEIIAHIAHWAAGYSSGLKWNEVAKLKADMMNVPERWVPVTVDALRSRCVAAGLSTEDSDTVADLLSKRKAGRRLVPQASYRAHRFPHEPGKSFKA